MASKPWHRNLDFSQYKQSRRNTFDILYITGKLGHNGVLSKRGCTEENLWKEFINKQKIKNILISWKKRVLTENNALNNKDDRAIINEITPFRMVLHRTHRMKMFYQEIQCDADCQYFLLLWIPCNLENGLNDNEYDQLISAFNEEAYFCNKLNKECIYISGPKYGKNEADYNNEDEGDTKFDLPTLNNTCHLWASSEVPDPMNNKLIIEIVVHEFDRKVSLHFHFSRFQMRFSDPFLPCRLFTNNAINGYPANFERGTQEFCA